MKLTECQNLELYNLTALFWCYLKGWGRTHWIFRLGNPSIRLALTGRLLWTQIRKEIWLMVSWVGLSLPISKGTSWTKLLKASYSSHEQGPLLGHFTFAQASLFHVNPGSHTNIWQLKWLNQIIHVQFSRSVVSDSLRHHESHILSILANLVSSGCEWQLSRMSPRKIPCVYETDVIPLVNPCVPTRNCSEYLSFVPYSV